MFWHKKEEGEKAENQKAGNPIKADEPQKQEIPQKPGMHGKFEYIKFYTITDSLAFEKKFYRKVIEQDEITYLNWEIGILNKAYGEGDWKATITTKCYKIDIGNAEMCNIPAEITVLKTVDIHRYRYSWGKDAAGSYWKAGIYRWDVYLNDELVGNEMMYINNFGCVTESNNPYFDISTIRLYPSFEDGHELKEGYRYLKQFNASVAEYINVELEVKRKVTDNFNFEFIYNIIRDDSYHIAVFPYFGKLSSGTANGTELIRYGWGSPKNFWKKGNYVVYVNFMGQKIAAAAFVVGDTDVLGTPDSVQSASKPLFTTTNNGTAIAKTTEDLVQEMDVLVGMSSVKESIRESIAYLKFNKIRIEKGFKDDSVMNLHSVFTGNPGTGKTTVVRLLGQIYKSLGFLSKGNVVEVGRAELIGEYIGQTAPKVKKAIADARGGILFIDEAYALKRGGDSKNDFGLEVIEILLKEMSDGVGDIAIVVAGYPEEMQIFINSNPGLKSRFKQYFHFDDYLPDELMDIAKVALNKEETKLDAGAEIMLKQYITEQYRSRDRSFGNARLMYGIIDGAKKQMGLRLLKNEQVASMSGEELSTITAQDLQAMLHENNKQKLTLSIEEKELKDALNELNELTGLEQIKREISDVTSLVRFYNETGKDVLNRFSLHAILTGNPGTGKTTLARLLGKIYKALGLLERGHLVEVDRQSLVAGYIGQTAIKTAAVIDKAVGGVLFIDEAYSLSGGGENDFGQEAIETILKTMEDKRGQFAVIAAGYTENMETFLKSNPGLKSRFDKTYNLPDYTAEELMQVALHLLLKENLVLATDAETYLQQYFTECYANRDRYFGNARSVRQAIESIINKQNLRLAAVPTEQRTAEMMQQALMEDVNHLVAVEQRQRNAGIGFRKY